MHSYPRKTLFIVLAAALLSACNRMPDHVRYIPKDAVAVAGVNLKSLSTKIAWNLVTGSKLFKDMQKRMPEKTTKDAINGIEKAGIDALNTIYVYVKTDTRFKGGNRITGLVPLSDAGQWEKYVKEVFPNVAVKQKGDRKEASLGSDMYVGWNKNLLIIINVMAISGEDEGDGQEKLNISSKMNQEDISAEMENAFSVTKENSIVGNPHFTELEQKGHDITFWLNYEQLMTQYSGDMSEKMGGISLSNTIWKDAAFTMGFDFVKGKITGDMRYLLPEQMNDIGKEFGAMNADKDMIDRLPTQNMDLALTGHLSPAGLKSMMERMGLLGLANAGLATQGLTVDSLLGAFTGDMAMVINDFSLHTEKVMEPFMGQMVAHDVQKPGVSLSYVIKLDKKENIQPLIKLAQANGLLAVPNGFAVPIDEQDSVYVIIKDKYLVLSNKLPFANGILDGNFKSEKKPAPISELTGYPWGMYIDALQFFKNVDPAITHSSRDSTVIVESSKLLNNISFKGGAFKDHAFEFHLDINFMNADENSIIDLMDYGMKISDAENIKN
jgi:hypothetical protein